MADEEQGWWGSILQAAKDKSVEVMEFVRRDLDEFSSAVRQEASSVMNSTATVIKDKFKIEDQESTAGSMKKSFSTLLGQVSNVLNPQPEDGDEEAILIQGPDEPVMLSALQLKVHVLTSNIDTYLVDPSEDPELAPQYQAWLDYQDDESFPESRLSALLNSYPDLSSHYEKLVPSEVSHLVFWQRFLFRKAVLEDKEAKQEAKRKRLERENQRKQDISLAQTLNTDLKVNGPVDLSEEEQIRILREYEIECEVAKGNLPPESLSLLPNHYSPPSSSHNLSRPTDIKTREKRDMVIVGEGASSASSGHTSAADKESNDEDWEKEFDLDEIEPDNVEVATG